MEDLQNLLYVHPPPDCQPGKLPDAQCEKCRQIRNSIIGGTILQIDVNFREFADLFYAGRAGLEIFSDLTVLGLTTAGTLAGGEAVKAILSATAGAVTGARLSVNENVFKQQATDIFLNAMQALRAEKAVEIKGKLSQSIADYSIYEAFDDLLAYYDAGTIRAAYQVLQKSTVTPSFSVEQFTKTLDLQKQLVAKCDSVKAMGDNSDQAAQAVLQAMGKDNEATSGDYLTYLRQMVNTTFDLDTLTKIKNAFDTASKNNWKLQSNTVQQPVATPTKPQS